MVFRETYTCANIIKKRKRIEQIQWLPPREGKEKESGKFIEVLRV